MPRIPRSHVTWTVLALLPLAAICDGAEKHAGLDLRLSGEVPLAKYGGVPFCVDVDRDADVDILWLQSPGLFHSKVFLKPPYTERITPAERDHFCLTATDAAGHVMWQIGEPWQGERPFVTHSAERALDWVDGDGTLEIVCARRGEILVINAVDGQIERRVNAPADNCQIIVLGKTGPKPTDWTILAKNAESAYAPYEYANPAWFYDPQLRLLKTASYLGAGHAPQAVDLDDDGLDEFLIGFCRVDHELQTVWKFEPVPPEQWSAGEMHVDDLTVPDLSGNPLGPVSAAGPKPLATGTWLDRYPGESPVV